MDPSCSPDVSVVIPTRNRHAMLRRCLDGLALQDHPSFEVVVIDDASSDATEALLAERDGLERPRVRALRNDKRRGANPSRNRGVASARGSIVAFLDDDAIPEPGWLSELGAAFEDPGVGAATGLVKDAPPRNVFELARRGTHRVIHRGKARRLAGTNMAVLRRLVQELTWDEDRQGGIPESEKQVTVSGRGDEEGLFLLIRALGWRISACPRAVVVHEHHFTAKTFLRQGFRGGRAAERLVYKYRLRPRTDMVFWVLAYASSPALLLAGPLWLVPVGCVGVALSGLLYNEFVFKGKSLGEVLRSLPALLLFYQARLLGYVIEWVHLRCRTRATIARVNLETFASGHHLRRPST